MKRRSKTVLVTGGAGFIGTNVCRRLADEGYEVRSLDLKDPKCAVLAVDYVRGDVRSENDLRKALRGVSAVYHFAAIVSVAECQEKPDASYVNNFMGTVNVLEAARNEATRSRRPPGVVFAGSSAVYGAAGRKGKPIRETEVSPYPLSFYASQKYSSEGAIRLYHENYGIPAVIFRFFNVYGEGQDSDSPYSSVITTFARLAREGKDISLHGGGMQTRDFVSVKDVARANAKVLKLPMSEWRAQAVNLGSGVSLSIRELGEMVLRLSKKGGRLVEAPARPGDVSHSLADVSRSFEILRWRPEVDLEKGLAGIV